MVIGETDIKNLIVRYDGIGAPLTRDEEQLLLLALYTESEARGGIVLEARRLTAERASKVLSLFAAHRISGGPAK